MRICNLFFAVLFGGFVHISASAQSNFDINDCIIDGLKGVQSDIAAKMVKEACERKQQQRPDWKVEQYMKQLGSVIDTGSVELLDSFTNAAPGYHGLLVRNTDATSTVTFIRLKITPAPVAGKGCDYLQSKFETFRLNIPPAMTATLHYPSRGGQESCYVLVTVFAKETTPSEKPTTAPVRALSRDPLEVSRQ